MRSDVYLLHLLRDTAMVNSQEDRIRQQNELTLQTSSANPYNLTSAHPSHHLFLDTHTRASILVERRPLAVAYSHGSLHLF